MDIGAIGVNDIAKARELATAIEDRAYEIKDQIFHFEKELKKLTDRKR
jgi:hypothetical protein